LIQKSTTKKQTIHLITERKRLPCDTKLPVMPLYNFKEMPGVQIWDQIKGPIAYSEQVMFGYLHIAAGSDLPSHQHPHEQWSHLIQGEFNFTVGSDTYTMKPGMSVHIPGDTPHSGKALSDCIFLDCFHPVREDWIQRKKDQGIE
jgi:quercetin dioxygenase-like cupin family protein